LEYTEIHGDPDKLDMGLYMKSSTVKVIQITNSPSTVATLSQPANKRLSILPGHPLLAWHGSEMTRLE